MPSIAIVGMACRYPDARSPAELWESALAQRRAFRRIPPERLSLEDYYSPDPATPDHSYAFEAAVIEGYEFDRVLFRVAGSTFRSADPAHWLALDIASQALADAGFAEGENLPRKTTGVLLGNTLTGEFSRAHVLRLRWPYVRRVLDKALNDQGWTTDKRGTFMQDLETLYKAPFPPVGEETLAGGLSNTIAGRICNHFDLKGGGYTIDGACSASLLAVTNACSALVAGDLDVALAGGVDLSLDPFELVGFAKTGALAPEEMRVYDARSAGFWPGEGCGFVVLMRLDEARAQHRRIYAVIRGWGISSDGSGGITRPEVEGQKLAFERAYRRAGFGIDTITYFEGHGTGTNVGDATELKALSQARREADKETRRQGDKETGRQGDRETETGTSCSLSPCLPVSLSASPAIIGTIKANIGHTKAAAGMAGLIKATMALHTQILPPTTGCEQPHPELCSGAGCQPGKEQDRQGDRETRRQGEATSVSLSPCLPVSLSALPVLQVLRKGQAWPADRPLRAAVSAMGFGGINTHCVLEGYSAERRQELSPSENSLLSSAQDAELFLLGAADRQALHQQVDHLLTIAARLSRAELTDLAAKLASDLPEFDKVRIRAAIVASTPADLAGRLETVRTWLSEGIKERLDTQAGVFLGSGSTVPRIGFLFPGQGSPAHLSGGAWRRRFGFVDELYTQADFDPASDGTLTAVAQPAIVTASLAGLHALEQFGITASITVGHSLGELPALYWAGAIGASSLLSIARTRGRAMADLGSPTGAMASIAAGQYEVGNLVNGEAVIKAGLNSPRQTVISGEADAVAAVVARARARGLRAVMLPVSHAFHSPLVAAATPALADHLSREEFQPVRRPVVSTVTGSRLAAGEDLRGLLCRQVTSPVRFMEAVTAAMDGLDLLIEVGPGQVLTSLVSDFLDTPVVATDAGGPSLAGLLQAIGAAFVQGTPVNHPALFAGRLVRPFNLEWQPRFFVNPCELAPRISREDRGSRIEDRGSRIEITNNKPAPPSSILHPPSSSPLELIRQLVAQRAELPASAVKDNSRLLDDLHLNSIAVGQLVAEASRRLGLAPPAAPTDYSAATIAQVAKALEELQRTGGGQPATEKERLPAGVDTWVRSFVVDLVERPLSARDFRSLGDFGSLNDTWRVIAPPDHPLVEKLGRALTGSQGTGGIVVCLPPDPDERHVRILLDGARAILEERDAMRFVLVQHGGGGAALARTLKLEKPEVTTCVVDVPLDHPGAIEWIVAEARAAHGHVEAHYDSTGVRRVPVLRLLSSFGDASVTRAAERCSEASLNGADVLLVTGGGKGIAAECALSLARETGTQLALMGRSLPDLDEELKANLERIAAAGIRFHYVSADVTDAAAVCHSVEEIEKTLGPVTAVLHGAGANVPRLLKDLDEAAFAQTLAPKIQGARNVLAAVNPERLRLFVTFGSIIARTGLRGEADYAVANDWLAHLTERWQANHPHCRCLTVEWSVWSGVGMGHRLGSIDTLLQQGITPIPPDEGVRVLRELIGRGVGFQPASGANGRLQTCPTRVVVTGRFGEPPTLQVDRPELPLQRFLERPRVYYPGVELVTEAELSSDTDPYLADHVFRGNRLFPAVMGLEAMAQAAMALAGTTELPVFENVKFTRPVVVPEGSTITIRVAALVRAPGCVDVVLRSEETDFAADHFRATCAFHKIAPTACGFTPTSSNISLEPRRDLYGNILFHTGRFRRLNGYRQLKATECVAEITADTDPEWFGRYLPGQLVLGDPAARDAAIHAIQACIPHATILPIGVERIVPRGIGSEQRAPVLVHARERSREGNTFVYDMEVTDPVGRVLESWEGLHLRIAESMTPGRSWAAPLLGPYIERRVGELVRGSRLAVAFEQNGDGGSRSNRAIQQAIGQDVIVRRRPDGKPEIDGRDDLEVSVSHAGELVLAVAGAGPLGCDVEPVTMRDPSVWHDLLGRDRLALAELIVRDGLEDRDTAATRIWAASECLKKAGRAVDAPLVLASSGKDGWVLLGAGPLVISTYLATVNGSEERLVIAVLVRTDHARL